MFTIGIAEISCCQGYHYRKYKLNDNHPDISLLKQLESLDRDEEKWPIPDYVDLNRNSYKIIDKAEYEKCDCKFEYWL